MATQLCNIIITRTSQCNLLEISKLHASLFGPGRFVRAAYRVRESVTHVSPFCHIAKCDGIVIASISFTKICIGNKPGALMLGPLAVNSSYAGFGIGRNLIQTSLNLARSAEINLVTLVGDLAYYKSVGFAVAPKQQILLPGPFDYSRVLICELRQGASLDYKGMIRPV
ncbi:MAG: N-acetyltransferase [Hyphomicrobiaceae bacterium]|nr:N-acetyltransferase [Hyphomicrobiaceae bacterium]